jgi:hypothetical protein
MIYSLPSPSIAVSFSKTLTKSLLQESIAASLAGLKSLKELYIAPSKDSSDLTLPLGPYYLHPCRFGQTTSLQHELSLLYPFLPYIVDGIDAALGILLVGGVSCPEIAIEGIVPPYFGIFDQTLIWGRGVPRMKRWVKNGTAKNDVAPGAFRGGNIGDRYKCVGVEGEWEMMSSLEFREWKIEPLGRRRVPPCCARTKKMCKSRE